LTNGSKERQPKKLHVQTSSIIQYREKDSKLIVKPKATKAMRLKQIQIKFDNLYSPQNFKNEFKYETNVPKPRIE
jgi:hypothetical protein